MTNLTANHASALTYNNSIDLEYTFVPTVRVSFDTNTGFVIEDLAPGTAAYSNTVTVTAGSNMADGYNLLASVGDSTDANRNNNRLVNADNVNYFESVAANADLELSALGENKWGYAVYDSVNSTWSNYNGLPAVSANNANDVTLTSANSAGSTDVVMKIGASATNTQVAGEFTNKINFFVTTNVVTYDYSITYNANNPSSTGTVTNMPNNILSASLNTGDTLQADSTIPVLNGYIFAGWCDGSVSGNVCSGNSYHASDYLKITNPIASDNTSSTINNLTLTAMWKPYMQNVDDWKDVMLAEVGSEAIAVDSRDGNEYWVARLCMNDADPSACVDGTPDATNANSTLWMTQNLDLTIGGEYNGESIILDSTNTDINTDNINGVSFAAYTNNDGVITWDPANIRNGEITFPTSGTDGTVSGWTNSNTTPFQAEGIDANRNKEVFVYNGTRYFGLAACEAARHTEAQCMHYHVGNYYNFTAAVAMSYSGTTTDDGGSTYFDDDKYVMPNSICPKGWRLPNGLTNDNGTTIMSDFNRVLKASNVTGTGGTNGIDLAGGVNVGYSETGWSTINRKPFYFVRSGYLSSTLLGTFSSRGNYWFSTVNSDSNAYYLSFYTGHLSLAARSNRSTGRSVRCVAR